MVAAVAGPAWSCRLPCPSERPAEQGESGGSTCRRCAELAPDRALLEVVVEPLLRRQDLLGVRLTTPHTIQQSEIVEPLGAGHDEQHVYAAVRWSAKGMLHMRWNQQEVSGAHGNHLFPGEHLQRPLDDKEHLRIEHVVVRCCAVHALAQL